MITIKIKRNKTYIYKIDINGHARYADCGKDIVCAAVSATVLTTVNAVLIINKEIINYKEMNNQVSIIINKHDPIIEKLINNMVLMLQQLVSEYNKYISIIEEV